MPVRQSRNLLKPVVGKVLRADSLHDPVGKEVDTRGPGASHRGGILFAHGLNELVIEASVSLGKYHALLLTSVARIAAILKTKTLSNVAKKQRGSVPRQSRIQR